MAARPETARKILLYWMDGSMALVAVISVAFVAGRTMAGAITTAHAALVITCQLGLCGLFPFVMREAFDRRPRPGWKLMVSGVFATGTVLLRPPAFNGASPVIEMGLLWLSAAALYLSLRATACLAAVVVALFTVYATLVHGQSWLNTLVGTAVNAFVMVTAMLLWRWLWWMIRDAHHSREARARLAVAEERLRFARDLHDLLGHSLSVITLKSELAAKLATKDPGRALAEMAEVRGLAADSLAEVQQAVHGYQALDLDQELAGVRAALEAAGARCVVRARPEDLSPPARALLAWVVREGGTNVLKHSAATYCAITIDGGVLEMRNDGVPQAASRPGSGLRGLAERLVAAGGTLSAATTADGEFLLRATVPVGGELPAREVVPA
ncbi:sensor histidine kinase [Nonomuraea sp. NPDC050783]|uniref:sensor histidine kinase n=1 Tax=Nonomuraea sp. NPDC050783 TaxID=3154634 RepID=UPI003465020A